jgi:hypothetical protein
MKRLFIITAIILALSAGYAYSHMQGGGMMGQGMMGEQGQAATPGYGMMGQTPGSGMMGYGGHMMGDMMGSGGHMGCGKHMMGGILGYSTEEEQRKFLDDTLDLRRQMHNKRFEFSEALRKPDTDRKTLIRLKKEMLQIKLKMYDRVLKSN